MYVHLLSIPEDTHSQITLKRGICEVRNYERNFFLTGTVPTNLKVIYYLYEHLVKYLDVTIDISMSEHHQIWWSITWSTSEGICILSLYWEVSFMISWYPVGRCTYKEVSEDPFVIDFTSCEWNCNLTGNCFDWATGRKLTNSLKP